MMPHQGIFTGLALPEIISSLFEHLMIQRYYKVIYF